jgi:tetratricopeptide (TPR) repeat protein
MVQTDRRNGVLAAVLVLVLIECPAALRAQGHPAHTQLKVLYEQANRLRERGEYKKASDLCEQMLRLAIRTFGPEHLEVALVQHNLAVLYERQSRYAEAERLFKRSLEIREARLGPDHPDVATTLNKLAHLHAAQGHWTDARGAKDRARRTSLRHIVRVLPALAEKEQLTFLNATNKLDLHLGLSLALVGSDDREMAARSAGWVLNSKGLAHQALAERALLARGGQDSSSAKIVSQLRAVRNKLAALTLATPRPGQENDRKRELARFNEQERELSKELGQVTGRPRRDDPWVEPGAVRKVLPADAVLIEIARFNIFNFQAKGTEKKWHPARYAAWVIPPVDRGEVHVIDLGEAKPIDAAVAAARKALQPELELLRSRGEPDAEQQVQEPLQVLSRLVLQPLLPHICQAKRWLISPDATLWLVPWGALPLTDGRYAIEGHLISYVISSRDLVADPGSNSMSLEGEPSTRVARMTSSGRVDTLKAGGSTCCSRCLLDQPSAESGCGVGSVPGCSPCGL